MYKTYSIILSLIIWSSPLLPADNNSILNLINSDESPSQPLVALLAVVDIQHNGTIEDVLAQTQKQWKRKEGQQRCNVEDQYEDKKETIFPLLKQIGVIDAIDKPKKEYYDFLLVHGGLYSDMVPRIALMQHVLKTVKFRRLVFLTGERVLDPIFESGKQIFGSNPAFEVDPDLTFKSTDQLPTTEADLCYVMFERALKPDKWKHAPLQIITSASPQINRSNKTEIEIVSVALDKRPTTATSIQLWLQSQPANWHSVCLAISNQPYVGRQDAIARAFLPPNLEVETIGAAASDQLNSSVYLDDLARALYVLKYRR